MTAPTPVEIFRRAAKEGNRRLDQSLLELTSTGFIAGFTIVFGIAALGIVHALAEPLVGEFARVLGALGFGLGIVFLIVGRAELFSENFFDPIAAAFEPHARGLSRRLVRLWTITFALNLLGGGILVALLSLDGAVPPAAHSSLETMAAEIAKRDWPATLARSVVGGALVSLLSFLAIAIGSGGGRAAMAYAIGVLLAIGPFDHAVVSLLHLGFGLRAGEIVAIDLVEVGALTVLGNLIGGVGLVALSHAAQAKGAERGGE